MTRFEQCSQLTVVDGVGDEAIDEGDDDDEDEAAAGYVCDCVPLL